MSVEETLAVTKLVEKALSAGTMSLGEASVRLLSNGCLLRAGGHLLRDSGDANSFTSVLDLFSINRSDLHPMDSKMWRIAMQTEFDEALHDVLLCDSLFEETPVRTFLCSGRLLACILNCMAGYHRGNTPHPG